MHAIYVETVSDKNALRPSHIQYTPLELCARVCARFVPTRWLPTECMGIILYVHHFTLTCDSTFINTCNARI